MTKEKTANPAEIGGANIAESNTKKAATKAIIPSVLLLISIIVASFKGRQ